MYTTKMKVRKDDSKQNGKFVFEQIPVTVKLDFDNVTLEQLIPIATSELKIRLARRMRNGNFPNGSEVIKVPTDPSGWNSHAAKPMSITVKVKDLIEGTILVQRPNLAELSAEQTATELMAMHLPTAQIVAVLKAKGLNNEQAASLVNRLNSNK